MIMYNMRFRGAYEYDKFVLNILQLSNIINLNQTNELEEMNNDMTSLRNINKKINELFDIYIGSNNKMGLSEQKFIKSFNL